MKMLFFLGIIISNQVYAQEVKLNDIHVFGHQELENLLDFSDPDLSLKGKELLKKRQTSIGDTLQNEVGVNSTSFGPNAGQPVVRGQTGQRVKIMQNGLSALDAAAQSVDHALAIDPLTVDQIQILRGPETLLYGTSVVGGVVNISSNRIHSEYEEGNAVYFLSQVDSGNNGINNALQFSRGSNKWMYHFDASTRNLGDQVIPDYARSSRERSANPLAPGEKEVQDKLANSFNHQDNFGLGVSRIYDRGYYGVSANYFTTQYGVVAEEEVSIDMVQTRIEIAGKHRLEKENFVKLINYKIAHSGYSHQELEGSEVGTEFENSGFDSRVEFMHKNNLGDGAFGFQALGTEFLAKGDEAFLPEATNNVFALFFLQEYKKDMHKTSLGLRAESNRIKREESVNFGNSDSKNISTKSVSLEHQVFIDKETSLSFNASYVQRAPNFQELYADGAHVAIGIYENGDEDLEIEQAYVYELSINKKSKMNSTKINFYTQKFQDYINLTPTGVIDGGSTFEIFDYSQNNARFSGMEYVYNRILTNDKGREISLETKADFIYAINEDTDDYLPRISPPRLSLGFDYKKDKWNSDIQFQYVGKATKLAPSETRTDGYLLTNMNFNYNSIAETGSYVFFAQLRNLFNIEARNHVSTLKEISPLQGRSLVLGLQLSL